MVVRKQQYYKRATTMLDWILIRCTSALCLITLILIAVIAAFSIGHVLSEVIGSMFP